MGPTSDVYSLGATLYYLLTGRPPIEDPGLLKLLIRVQEGDFPRPREINPNTPAALQAICLKAMALVPSDRYPSARALAEDVDRWLADEPVTAYRAAWHERLARWGRRHRRSVEVGAAALIVIAVVSIVAVVLVHGAKREVEEERDEVRLALEAEKSAKLQAHAALEAERAAKTEARRAIDNYVQLVSEDDSLKDEQMQPLRRQLLEDARRYYQQLIDKDGRDAHVRHDLANAILRVGRLSNIGGSKQEAIDAFQQARTAFQELVEAHPDELKYRSDLALCYRSLGVLETEIGTPAKALACFRQSLQISAAVAAALGARPLSASRPRELFDVACDLARCAPEGLDSDAERALARQADTAAVNALHEAIAAGFRPDLAANRSLKGAPWGSVPRFKAAIEKLGYIASPPALNRARSENVP
jgi:serine/threonine-protein kinase